MKKIVLLCVMLVFVGGCESAALVGSGLAGGMTLQRIIQQQQAANQENIDLMEQQKLELEAQIAAETDEAKKAELQKAFDNTETVLLDLKTQKEALKVAAAGAGTDWKNPQAVIQFLALLATGYYADRERRKKNKTNTALAEVVAGGQAFKKAVKEEADILAKFKEAQNEAQKSPETKKMIAVIKA